MLCFFPPDLKRREPRVGLMIGLGTNYHHGFTASGHPGTKSLRTHKGVSFVVLLGESEGCVQQFQGKRSRRGRVVWCMRHEMRRHLVCILVQGGRRWCVVWPS